jgi:hypothetical protein
MPSDDTATLERVEQRDDARPNDRNAALAMVAASGDDQHLVGALNLLLPKPRLGAGGGGGPGWQRFAKVERSVRTEAHLIERLADSFQSNAPIPTIHGTNLPR